MRRLLLLITVLLISTALPASAKMPPFDMEVEPRGDVVHVTVTISGDESLTDGFDSPELNGLIAVLPLDEVDDDGRPTLVFGDRADVPLERVGPGVYQGSVTVEAGRWAIVPFPHTVGALTVRDAYPETVTIETGGGSTGIWSLALLITAAAITWQFRDVVSVKPL